MGVFVYMISRSFQDTLTSALLLVLTWISRYSRVTLLCKAWTCSTSAVAVCAGTSLGGSDQFQPEQSLPSPPRCNQSCRASVISGSRNLAKPLRALVIQRLEDFQMQLLGILGPSPNTLLPSGIIVNPRGSQSGNGFMRIWM